MQTITVPIAITSQERARIREEEILRNEEQERRRVFEQNRKANKPDPRPGDKLIVATARGIKGRGRAGLQFSETPTEVKVVDLSDTEVAAKQLAGASIVNPWGAAQILADANEAHTGLIVFANQSEAAAHQPKLLDDHELEDLEAAVARKRAQAREPEQRIGSTRKLESDDPGKPGDTRLGVGDPKAKAEGSGGGKPGDKPSKG